MKRRAAALLNDVNASAHVIEQLIWIWLPSALHVAQRIGQRGNGATFVRHLSSVAVAAVSAFGQGLAPALKARRVNASSRNLNRSGRHE
jgi:hypothetical protein